MMRPLVALPVLVAIACNQSARSSSSPPAVRFELRGLRNVSETSTFGTSKSTSFTHTGTVVAHADDSAALRRTYTVCYRVRRLSGGDPDSPQEPNALACAIVMNGVGDLQFSGGYRTSAETWEPEKIELTPHGFFPWYPMSGESVKEP
jgi:hypothetical protein